ncbi:MAG: hypothetical protein PHH21_01495 [Candidatus Pacebacteria bacterium]|nr:hypothetical protein [Candidatus Paceibacterota bacterium]
MNKRYKIIVVVVFILALIVAGFFYYNKAQEDKMGPVSFESFKRIEADGKVFMENKDIGLKFEVPDGWKVDNAGWSTISLISDNFVPFKEDMANAPLANVGCWIDITAEKEQKTENYINNTYNFIKELKSYPKDGVSIINVGGYDSLKTVSSIGGENQVGENVYIETPNNNIIYTFQLSYLKNNTSDCLNIFNKFLDSASITNK